MIDYHSAERLLTQGSDRLKTELFFWYFWFWIRRFLDLDVLIFKNYTFIFDINFCTVSKIETLYLTLVHPYCQSPGYEDGLFQVALAPLFGPNVKLYHKWIKTKTAELIPNLRWPSHWVNFLLLDQYIHIFKQATLKKWNVMGSGDIILCAIYWIVGTFLCAMYWIVSTFFDMQFIGLLGLSLMCNLLDS
jgi:hypothetical protein